MNYPTEYEKNLQKAEAERWKEVEEETEIQKRIRKSQDAINQLPDWVKEGLYWCGGGEYVSEEGYYSE